MTTTSDQANPSPAAIHPEQTDLAFLFDGGAAGDAVRNADWSTSPIGPPATWPASLRTVLNLILNSPESIYLCWGPELVFFHNDAYAPILGDRLHGAQGQPLRELWGDAWEAVRPAVEEALSGKGSRFEDVAIDMARAGIPERTWWTFSFSPLNDDMGRIAGILCITKETTHEVASRAALLDHNRSLEARIEDGVRERREIWSVSQDMLLVVSADGTVRAANPAWERSLGHAPDAMAGRHFDAFSDPDDASSRFEALWQAAHGATPRCESRFRHADGSWRDLDWTLAWSGDALYCAARDVTQEKARAAALILFENIVQSDHAPICAFDPELRLIAFNQAHSNEFFRIYGHRVQVGEVFPDLFLPEQATVMRGFMMRAIAGEVFTVVEEFGDPALVKPYWEVAYSPLRDAQGRIFGAFHHAQDISPRLRAEAGLQAAQEALRQSQKMEAVGQLTGGVAHDFNNLLTVIKSSSDLLKRPDLSQERRDRYVGAISSTVDRAAKLTGQLLAFARRQALKPEVFDACVSIRSVAEMLGTLTGSRISVEIDLPDGACGIDADPSQFDTAIVNLAVNARDAMSGEGRMTLSVRPADNIPALRGSPAVEGDFVSVSLSDTGSGIPVKDLERVFEPFFTTKGVGQGTGLGLSQVIGFVQQSGGEVRVESAVGEGTTFTLYLPRVTNPSPTGKQDAEPEAFEDGHGTRVLVVEDNADVGAFATQTLWDLGYVTVLAGDARQALHELERDSARFDIVFSDVIMPGMDGVELAREIRRRHRGLPVVLTSGYSHVLAQDGTHGFELLHKPYSVDALSRVLRRAIAKAGRRRVAPAGR